MTATLSGWTYQELLDKARRDLNRLRDARTATKDDVYNFICTAAPLWEWLDKDGRPAAKAAADEMKAEFDADPSHHPVQLVFDVFKGVKHVERRNTSVKEKMIHTGTLGGGATLRGNPAFTLQGGTVNVFMIEVDGEWQRLSDVGASAVAAWECVLTKHGLPI
jgi:predicted Rdx family selenoprotein